MHPTSEMITLLKSICAKLDEQNAYLREQHLAETEKQISPKHCAKRRQSLHRLQLATMCQFVERHPITPSMPVMARAHQCWLEHFEEWEAAAKEGRGYSHYKSLARAYNK